MTNDQLPMTKQIPNPKFQIPYASAGADFFSGILSQQLGSENLFRITITSFLDAYNFDVRRVMKCCTHHVLPSGHVIPFCAYNVLYRDGHVPLPALRDVRVGEGASGRVGAEVALRRPLSPSPTRPLARP